MNLKSGNIEGFEHFSRFICLREFNTHIEMWFNRLIIKNCLKNIAINFLLQTFEGNIIDLAVFSILVLIGSSNTQKGLECFKSDF
jgi:hypothetical protein